MDYSEHFDTIRPYNDLEAKAAIGRLANSPQLEGIINFLFEGTDSSRFIRELKNIDNIFDFQNYFSYPVVRNILAKTSRGVQSKGHEDLDPAAAYLFLANHRDIVMDASIMQMIYFESTRGVAQVTFGDNLMSSSLVIDIAKLNKVFPFFRGGTRMTQYRNAQISSAYINHVVREKGESVWIAQRNGRTKDGYDRTQPGLIKMLALGSDSVCRTLTELNILPVTISYEYEPCDLQKVRETYLTRRGPYVKAPEEDFQSIMSGITGDKGRISISFGKSISGFLKKLKCEEISQNAKMEEIVKEVDRQIHGDYQLWPINYVAADMLRGDKGYEDHYEKEDREHFEQMMEEKIGQLKGFDRAECRKLFQQLYANPVFNKSRP